MVIPPHRDHVMIEFLYPHRIENGHDESLTFVRRVGARLEGENEVAPGSGHLLGRYRRYAEASEPVATGSRAARWTSRHMLIAAVAGSYLSVQPAPRDGPTLFAAMHNRYAATWFKSLTFTQRTVTRRPDGSEAVSTWYEAQKGQRLRIDIGDPALGNGVLYTPDSMYVVRGGKLVRSTADGNPFLPLIVGIFTQPVPVTIRQLAPLNVDMSKVYQTTWEGQPTYVLGALSAGDTTSPQIWVEKERLTVTRVLAPLSRASSNNIDIRMEKNVQVGGGWLATVVRMLDNGVAMQTEEYSDWHVDVALPESFFEASRWSEAPHWKKQGGA